MIRASRASWLLLTIVPLAGFAGCQVERSREGGSGVHPPGFAEPTGDASHALLLRREGYPLAECRECHGADYAGGRVESSCLSSGCHTEGVESCDTCHAAEPVTGAHAVHGASYACTTCHAPHDDARSPDHPNGTVEIQWGGLAEAHGRDAAWDPGAGTCAEVYCHGDVPRSWTEDAGPLGCDDCHEGPPEDHLRFVEAEGDCAACHAGEAQHLDGRFDLRWPGCDGCHGEGPRGAPPVGLLGQASGGAVGAHARHLDPTIEGRIGPVAACEDCHRVPRGLLEPGHLDAAAPADVDLRGGGTYDAAARTCVVDCHGGRTPGPAWDDGSGAARACDACHDMPPATIATGGPHPGASPDPASCETCHPLGLDTHLDGRVEVIELGCDGCHGAGPLGAPPPGLGGELSGGAIGAHVRHLDGTLTDRIGRVARCSDCHEVPGSVDAPGHVDASPPADVRLWFGGSYDPAPRTCVTRCHWERDDPGPAWDDGSGAARACDACHAMPPPTTRVGTPHPPAAPELPACLPCHTFDPATHVDGTVDFAF